MEKNKSVLIVKPENCVLAFGIPTSKAAFFSDLKRLEKDFAKRFVWSRYYVQFIQELEEVTPLLKDLGVTIVTDLKLQDYGKLFQKYGVVILFSHWKENKVEFEDGLQEIEKMIPLIPDTFDGTVDLCVCHPKNLAELIRREKPNCLVRYIDNEATPFLWLNFYSILFRHLKEQNLTYLKALEDVAIEFLKAK